MVEEESLITNNKKAQLVHFSKINIFGDSGVGKTSLISHMENYANKNFKIVDDTNNSDDSKSSDSLNLSLGYVEQIKRIVIEYNDDRNLYFNVYETNLNRYDSIKMNLETILFQTECIIILWDNSKPETFDNISNFITTIESGIEENKFRKVPIFVIQNKIDLKMELEDYDEEEINDSINKLLKDYPQIIYEKKSLLNNNDFAVLLYKIYQKMELLERDINNNKYSHDILISMKFKNPKIKSYSKDKKNLKQRNMKIMLLGETNVGKSSFLKYLSELKLNKKDIKEIPLEIMGKKINVEIMEEDNINNISKNNYKDIDGILLFFDVTNENSLNIVNDWISSIKENFGEINNSYKLLLIANKIEDQEKRQILKKDSRNLAENNNIDYYECSCIKGINVFEILNEIIIISFEEYSSEIKKIENSELNKSKNIINENLNIRKNNSSKIDFNKDDTLNSNNFNENINVKGRNQNFIRTSQQSYKEIVLIFLLFIIKWIIYALIIFYFI